MTYRTRPPIWVLNWNKRQPSGSKLVGCLWRTIATEHFRSGGYCGLVTLCINWPAANDDRRWPAA